MIYTNEFVYLDFMCTSFPLFEIKERRFHFTPTSIHQLPLRLSLFYNSNIQVT
jgi:hypothetical protein